MAIGSIVSIIIIILAILLVFKIVKSVLKTIFFGVTVLFIVIFVLGFMVSADVKNFQENFPISDNMFLLEQEGILEGGIYGIFSEGGEPNLLVDSDIEEYNEYLSSDDLESLKGENYKVFIMRKEAFADIENLEVDGKPMTKIEVFEIIDSENALDDFRNKVGAGSNLQDDSEAKSILVASLIDASNKQRGAGFLIEEIKKGNIDVYPETTLFKTIKRLPSFILNNVIQVDE